MGHRQPTRHRVGCRSAEIQVFAPTPQRRRGWMDRICLETRDRDKLGMFELKMRNISMRVNRKGGVRPKFNSRGHVVLCLLSVAVHLCGCASGRPIVSTNDTETGKVSVRKVDFSEAPEMKELAERTRRIGNAMYPRVLEVLGADTAKLPKQFDIIFKKQTWRGNPGVTFGRRIRLNADWVSKNPAGLDMILIHEMAHVAQAYKWYNWFNTPSYWAEGMADYARFKLGYTNGWRCPQCSVEFPHFTSGYACAGAFLLFLDATCGSNVVRQLNAELRQGRYSDRFFAKATGRNLDELWAQFQKFPAYTPVAAEVNELHNALGYVNGKPPWNGRARFKAYLKQQVKTNQLLLVVA